MSNAKRVAVASKEGKRIDVHLGHVEKFYIYDVTPQGVTFVEERAIDSSNPDAERTPMDDILRALEGCQALLVAKIGGNRKEVLDARGIDSVSDYVGKAVEPSLLAYIQATR